MNSQTTDNLQAQIRMLEGSLAAKQKQLKDVETEIYAYKTSLSDKDIEIGRLRNDQAVRENANSQLIKDNRLLESDIVAIKEDRLRVERDADNLAIVNEQINKERVALEVQTKDTEMDGAVLRKRIEETEGRLEIAQRRSVQKESELANEIVSKNTTRDEVTRLNGLSLRLENEVNELATQAGSLESHLASIYKQCDDRNLLLKSKESEFIQSKAEFGRAEDRSFAISAELRKAREDNETLQRLLDQYRKDVDFQKKLREIETSKKLELEAEKRRLENEAISKEMEARTAHQYLQRVKDSHGQLLEDRMQLDEELNALKQHAQVLETQNMSLHNELESFVETDEIVRRDLYRKPRVEYIKNRNNEDLQQSIAKVRNSQSPVRRSQYNGYGSPYRSPSKY